MAVMPLTRVHLPPPYPRPHAPHKSDPAAQSAPSDQPSLTHLFTYSLIHSLRPYTLPSSPPPPATASTHSTEEIRDFLGVDSLGYLSLDGMLRAAGNRSQFCHACFSGRYPIPVGDELPPARQPAPFATSAT